MPNGIFIALAKRQKVFTPLRKSLMDIVLLALEMLVEWGCFWEWVEALGANKPDFRIGHYRLKQLKPLGIRHRVTEPVNFHGWDEEEEIEG
ncbi:hypothetical protein N7490_006581 [Penicillium lividum]|nr:hypothetical protein N7490_006581 [Penicillium lividum]